ncbi:MAG: precorrin-6y C5,15-methyltransferase (decarboxylating) subunit CbiE, partial [Deltaproteobacteria bacterium]|nr:precorrin-6y C5,15-methyltransferase (decarboxylating) subunit CbiE [Deltaproteobacteria bacterium]
MAKKVHIVGISQCFLEASKKQILDLFTDKKNRIDAVFAKKEDLSLLLWIREQISSINKNIIFESNGNLTRLNNAVIFYDGKIKFIIDYIKENLGKKNILILANGDPNFFGIGGTILSLLKENEKRFMEVYPAVSFMQAGFSKLKIPMTDALIISLHGRDFKNIHEALYSGKHAIGIYTDDINTPNKIYTELEERGFLEEFEFYVLTELCTKNEKIYKSFTKEILEDISGKKNIVVLNGKNKKSVELGSGGGLNSLVLGIDDDKYIHAAGEPTKKEIRSVSIGLMDLKTDSIIIDAGCGSGSISIEASAIAYKGIVYSIDKNEAKIENLKNNIKRFGRHNIEPILGELPEAMKNAAKAGQADSIFIGGGGGRDIRKILRESLRILKDKGVIVTNVITIDSLNEVLTFIKDYVSKGEAKGKGKGKEEGDIEIKYEIISVNVSRLKS